MNEPTEIKPQFRDRHKPKLERHAELLAIEQSAIRQAIEAETTQPGETLRDYLRQCWRDAFRRDCSTRAIDAMEAIATECGTGYAASWLDRAAIRLPDADETSAIRCISSMRDNES